MDLFANERRELIADLVKVQGSVNVSELMEKFNVSIETVRRDLDFLEKGKFLIRVHGGAVAPKSAMKIKTLKDRLAQNKENKFILSKTAVKFIKNGDVIFIDSGSTAIELATAIKQQILNITVVTNSPDVFDILSEAEHIKLIMCGGLYMPEERAFYGSLATDFIKSLHFSKAYVFPSGVSINNGISINFNELIEIQRATISQADEVFILFDGSKLLSSALYKVCDIEKNFTLITDKDADKNICEEFKKQGYRMIR